MQSLWHDICEEESQPFVRGCDGFGEREDSDGISNANCKPEFGRLARIDYIVDSLGDSLVAAVS